MGLCRKVHITNVCQLVQYFNEAFDIKNGQCWIRFDILCAPLMRVVIVGFVLNGGTKILWKRPV